MISARHLTIGELARATGTKVETVRYYERIGLLPAAPRTGSGQYRAYTGTTLGRLSFIRRARGLGFSLDQIRELLTLSDDRSHSCEAVDAIARTHLSEIQLKIKDLQALARELGGMLDSACHGTVAECRVIESLAPHPAPT